MLLTWTEGLKRGKTQDYRLNECVCKRRLVGLTAGLRVSKGAAKFSFVAGRKLQGKELFGRCYLSNT